jgi:uncharacterized membrane protein YkoI
MRTFQLTALVLASLISWSNPGFANPLQGITGEGGILNRHSNSNLRPQQSLSAREAVSIAERRYGGQAVDVRQVQSRGGVAYKVRILKDNGKIKNVIIDGR